MTIYDRPNSSPGGPDTRHGIGWPFMLTGIAGLLLFIAAWLVQSDRSSTAFWAMLVLGGLIAILSFANSGLGARPAVGWVVALLGVLTLVAPWVLGFSGAANLLWPCVILGIITAVLAAIGAMARPMTPAV